MIYKHYELHRLDLNLNRLILFYGKNEGLKSEEISKILSLYFDADISNYEEREILDNQSNFKENVLSKSLFEKKKIIIIKRATDKIFGIIEELGERNIEDLMLIINADNLEKKSKLRANLKKIRSIFV